MIFTIPILLYQLLFVVIAYFANRAEPRTGIVALVLSLLWTVTHIFLMPLALLQTIVVIASWWWFRCRFRSMSAMPRTSD